MTACGNAPAPAATTAPEVSVTMSEAATTTTVATTTTTAPTTTTEATTTTAAGFVREPIDPEKPLIALTFDDGPTSLTPLVLDKLEAHGIVGTFFLIGNNINDTTKEYVIRAHDMGSEIANHSQTHSQMGEFDAEKIKAEIEFTNSKIEEVVGETPKFFRPPYINTSDTMFDNIDLTFICGYLPNDYMDTVDTQARIDNTLKNAKDGRVILLHDFQGNQMTVDALDDIITGLKDEGYQFVTVSELFEYKGVTPNHSIMYTDVR